MAALISFATLGSGCSFDLRKTTTYTSPIDLITDFPPCAARGWALATPVAGLFVGVSDYSDRARVYPTWAHRISAIALHSPLQNAANETTDELKRAFASYVLVDTYRPPETASWFSPEGKFAGGWTASSELVTRARIMERLNAALQAAQLLHAEHGRALLVIYLSAHGWIHTDGEAYVVPADGDADAPETWISYRAIIEEAANFVGNDLSAQRRAIVVFDACQFNRHTDVIHKRVPAPPGVMIVRAAAPGQYAWHWTSTTTFRQEIYGTTGYRISFPVKPRGPKPGVVEQIANSTMSVVSIAAECSLQDARVFPEVTLADWANGMVRRANEFLDKIPENDSASSKSAQRSPRGSFGAFSGASSEAFFSRLSGS